MNPITIANAYDRGYSHGNDSTGMLGYFSLWPSDADFIKPDPFVRAYMKGYRDGEAERQTRGIPAWAIAEGE